MSDIVLYVIAFVLTVCIVAVAKLILTICFNAIEDSF